MFAGAPDYTIELGSADRISLTLFICFQESKRPSLSNEATLFFGSVLTTSSRGGLIGSRHGLISVGSFRRDRDRRLPDVQKWDELAVN